MPETTRSRTRVGGAWWLAALFALAAAPARANRPPPDAPPPQHVSNLLSALAQTAAVVEGVVTDIEHEYSEEHGPWTVVTLSNVAARLGSAPSTLVIRQFGGPSPDGKVFRGSHQLDFFVDKRYVVFLRNTSWNLSPVVGELALRVESVGGRELLVDRGGRAVTAVHADGLEFSEPLFQRADRASKQAPQPRSDVGARMSAAAAPVDRAALLASLRAHLQARRMAVQGAFFDEPAGRFTWRQVPVAPPPGATVAGSAPPSTGDGSEADGSRPPPIH